MLARAIQQGKTALISNITEPAVEVIDREMECLGGEAVLQERTVPGLRFLVDFDQHMAQLLKITRPFGATLGT